MSSPANPRGKPTPISTNGTVVVDSQQVCGFLGITSGTLSLSTYPDGVNIINAVPVTAGQYLEMPFYIGSTGYTVTLAGGASGVLNT